MSRGNIIRPQIIKDISPLVCDKLVGEVKIVYYIRQ